MLRKAIKKTWKVWWNEKRRGELHYIVITCTHTDSLVQSKRDFSRDKLSPADFILCAWSVSVCTNRGEGRCKVESADRKLKHCESSCYYVLGADLWSGCLQCAPLKTPLIAQHLVCAGGLRVPGNPFSKQPIKKKNFRHVIWHTGAHSYQRERWLTKSSGAWKKTQGEGKAPPPLSLIAALSDCGSLTVGVSAM